MGFGGGYGMGFGIPVWFAAFLPIIIIWSIFWKGLALWHSSQRKEVWWFVALLLINTMGILEIVYLFMFAKLKFENLFSVKGPDAGAPL